MTYSKTAIYKYRSKHPEVHRQIAMKYKLNNLEQVRINNLVCQQNKRTRKRMLAEAIKELMNIDLFD